MINVSLLMNSFMADTPSFTLIGDTSGGPPVNSTWTRNGEVINDSNSYSISLAVNEVNTTRLGNPGVFDGVILQESRYRSTLTVTGNLPGVYMYSVINRAMSAPRTASFTIEGIIILRTRMSNHIVSQDFPCGCGRRDREGKSGNSVDKAGISAGPIRY